MSLAHVLGSLLDASLFKAELHGVIPVLRLWVVGVEQCTE